MKVPETLNEWKDQNGIKLSAGLVVIQDNKILLVHPTNSPWWGTYSIPKGQIDKNENLLNAAIRETFEETGIHIKEKSIQRHLDGIIKYTDDKGNVYKKVYYFIAFPKTPIDKKDFKPQYEEVDWAGFLSKNEAEKRIFGRFKPLLKLLE
jgi:ADP-ribose pyrophosphatase YjhB (NUDIX family)